ncbi:MAG: hypothetical protein M3Y87_02915 [Myxococcota bacterium]|nr:hypothetical protein [Myxococcota bacterium]
MQPDERKLYIQILGQMLIADGVLADAERTYLDATMDGMSMSPDERRAALSGISLDSPVEERVASLSAATKQQLRIEIERAMGADGEMRRPESVLLERVLSALR